MVSRVANSPLSPSKSATISDQGRKNSDQIVSNKYSPPGSLNDPILPGFGSTDNYYATKNKNTYRGSMTSIDSNGHNSRPSMQRKSIHDKRVKEVTSSIVETRDDESDVELVVKGHRGCVNERTESSFSDTFQSKRGNIQMDSREFETNYVHTTTPQTIPMSTRRRRDSHTSKKKITTKSPSRPLDQQRLPLPFTDSSATSSTSNDSQRSSPSPQSKFCLTVSSSNKQNCNDEIDLDYNDDHSSFSLESLPSPNHRPQVQQLEDEWYEEKSPISTKPSLFCKSLSERNLSDTNDNSSSRKKGFKSGKNVPSWYSIEDDDYGDSTTALGQPHRLIASLGCILPGSSAKSMSFLRSASLHNGNSEKSMKRTSYHPPQQLSNLPSNEHSTTDKPLSTSLHNPSAEVHSSPGLRRSLSCTMLQRESFQAQHTDNIRSSSSPLEQSRSLNRRRVNSPNCLLSPFSAGNEDDFNEMDDDGLPDSDCQPGDGKSNGVIGVSGETNQSRIDLDDFIGIEFQRKDDDDNDSVELFKQRDTSQVKHKKQGSVGKRVWNSMLTKFNQRKLSSSSPTGTNKLPSVIDVTESKPARRVMFYAPCEADVQYFIPYFRLGVSQADLWWSRDDLSIERMEAKQRAMMTTTKLTMSRYHLTEKQKKDRRLELEILNYNIVYGEAYRQVLKEKRLSLDKKDLLGKGLSQGYRGYEMFHPAVCTHRRSQVQGTVKSIVQYYSIINQHIFNQQQQQQQQLQSQEAFSKQAKGLSSTNPAQLIEEFYDTVDTSLDMIDGTGSSNHRNNLIRRTPLCVINALRQQEQMDIDRYRKTSRLVRSHSLLLTSGSRSWGQALGIMERQAVVSDDNINITGSTSIPGCVEPNHVRPVSKLNQLQQKTDIIENDGAAHHRKAGINTRNNRSHQVSYKTDASNRVSGYEDFFVGDVCEVSSEEGDNPDDNEYHQHNTLVVHPMNTLEHNLRRNHVAM
jgi:hypothetical protein